MNELNGNLGPTPVPSGLTEFVLPSGQRFHMDLVAANREMARIFKATEGCQNGEDMDAWGAWLNKVTGCQFNLSQADWFWRFVVTERERARADFTRALQLLSSTPSTPAGLAPTN